MKLKQQDSDDVVPSTGGSDVVIMLRPMAPPAAMGLAAFAGSTWITATWLANWWGNSQSPVIFFPFVFFWGGLGQFIAGLFGYPARDVLVTVVHCLWGSFWMSIGLLYLLVGCGVVPAHDIDTHFPELATWLSVNMAFTWSAAIASWARDVVLSLTLCFLAMGSTLATAAWYSNGSVVGPVIKAAAYFFILSALTAWWRVTAFMLEEAYGPNASKYFPVFSLSRSNKRHLVREGLAEPGIKGAYAY